MPVSGNKEPGVLSQLSSSVSAGIPLKKRRFLLVQPSSPPHQEIPPSSREENDVKKKEDSSSNLSDTKESKEEYSDLKDKDKKEFKEECYSDLKNKEEYCSELKNKEGSCSELKISEASQSDLNNRGVGTDLKYKEDSNSNQGSVNANVGKNSLIEAEKESSDPNLNLASVGDLSRSTLPQLSPMVNVASVRGFESRTKLLLTKKSVSPEFLQTTLTDALPVGVKKETHGKLLDEDFNLKLSTGSANNEFSLGPEMGPPASGFGIQDTERNSAVHDKLDTSLLSLSLSKGNCNIEEKSNDGSSNSHTTNYASSNRSKWDLNTTMDDWEASAIDGTSRGAIDSSSKKTNLNVTMPSLNAIVSGNARGSKGKQVITTDGQRPFSTSSAHQNYKSADTTLTLSTFSDTSLAKLASRMDVSKSALGMSSAVLGVVKTEPMDENSKNQAIGASGSHLKLEGFNSVKREPLEGDNAHAARLSTNSSEKLVEQKSVKAEQAMDASVDAHKTGDVISQHSVAKFVHCQESISSSILPSTPQRHSPSRVISSSELSASMDVSNQSEHSIHTKEVFKGRDALGHEAAADMIYEPPHMNREAKLENYKVGDVIAPEMSRSESTKENSHDLHANREGSVSDEEKINISAEMMEDESYDSDCESDGNQVITNRLDTQHRCVKEDDEYEDGELREPNRHSVVEEPMPEVMDTENVKQDDHDATTSPACGIASGSDADKFVQGESKIQDDEAIECIKECVSKASSESNEQLTDKDITLQKVLPDGVAREVVDEKLLPHAPQRKPLDQSGKQIEPESNQRDILCDGATSSAHRALTAIGESSNENAKTIGDSTDENAKLVSIAMKPDSSISIVESSVNVNDATKDSMTGGSKSRIINLPRGTVTSPSKTRSITDRTFLSRSGRDRYFEGEKFLLHRNREVDPDGPQRFIREKIYDQPYRNSRPYGRGRGRFSGRLDTSRGEWDTEREFALESYNNDYRFSRNKRPSALADAELESNEFFITPDGSALSTGRGRKHLNDDLPSFRHISSRRLSPGSRDGPTTRDVRMLRRIPRNISPGRQNNDGSDLVGLQHDEKLVRPLPDEIIDPAYSRSQPIYDSGSGQFVRGNRNFSTVQRRGFPRVRSKSPVGSRVRSPGPWSPPRRRSPEGFGGLPQLSQHRTGPLYGMERIRSPDRSCFPEDIVARRRGSPSFMGRPSNDMRDVESGREPGHPRPMNSSRRSPSDRVFGRSARRVDVSDPRIGAGGDAYFGRPVHSNRFHEFHGDGSNDERRKLSERRGLVRSFRPSYIGDGENLRFHLDEGPRPFRFCPEADTEFGGRTMRERDFDGRIKNRQIVPPRRVRSIEEHEENYRHGGQLWHDDSFNEAPGFKRRRF